MSGLKQNRFGWKVGLIFAALVLISLALPAATYLPLSDADLARRSPVIARAEVLSKTVRLEQVNGEELPFTIVTLQGLETVKGSLKAEEFQLRLPGGQLGDLAWWVPGTPTFEIGEEVLLFLQRTGDSEYRLTEFGLSRFSIVDDEQHDRFAVRPSFEPAEDDFLSMRKPSLQLERAGESRALRDADSFLGALRSLAGNGIEQPVEYRQPAGDVSSQRGKPHPLWVNIGGVEGGTLFRWFWDTGTSPTGVVHASGTQTNLSDASDGTTHVQNAVDQWGAVPSTSVAYAGLSGSGNVTVYMDASTSFDGSTWTTPLSCSSGGVIGLGGPGSASGPRTFKGDGGYYAPHSGTVSMRQRTGSAGCYSAAVFRSAVLHELGHTLGLGHPDQGLVSIHSTTSSAAWAAAVMAAVIHSPYPDSPMTDDAQAISWYYGTGSGTPPTANFTFSPANPVTGQTVSFTDTSTGSPTSWSWNFGDGITSAAQNPTHAYASSGTFSVTLTAANANGSNQIIKSVPVALAPPTANFTFAPATPVTGQTVSFTNTSTGAPTSWSWNFGDVASGAANTSTLQNPTHVFNTQATYVVTLTATNAGGSNQIQKLVTVSPGTPPSANFNFAPSNPVTGQTVSFTDTSTGNPTSWSWNFGDGGTSTLQNPTHAYALSGAFSVTLTATNANGSNQMIKPVSVATAPPTANFTFSPSHPVTGQTVSFTDTSTGSPTSWSWNFGDVASGAANTSTFQNPTHLFNSQATYVVTLTATNAGGSNQIQKLVTVSPSAPPLTANFSFSPSNPVTVSFTDTSTGNPTSWSWNFGDPASGAANTSTLQSPTHVFNSQASYIVTLTVMNGSASNQAQKLVTVSPSASPVTANFNFLPGSPQTGQVVSFTDTSTGGPTSWSWNFGDVASGAANTSTLQNPTHLFNSQATYVVTLTVTNGNASNQAQKLVTVSPSVSPVTASFSFSPGSPQTSQPVSFSDTSTGGPTSWSWNFGDGNSSFAQNPAHAYAGAGIYTVQLQSSNADGSSLATRSITVSPPTSGRAGSVSLPVAGHVTGTGGVVFFTDVQIQNPNNFPVSAGLFFFPVGGGVSNEVSLSLGPLETRTLTDVVASQFGVTNSFGALRLDADGTPAQDLRMTSRTYDETDGGTFGMAISGLASAESMVASTYVTGIQRNSAYRTNLGAVNASKGQQSFYVILRGSEGAILGTSAPVSLPPGGQWQLGIKDLFPSVFGTGMTAEFHSVLGSMVPFAYGTLADNLSGDLTYFPSLRPEALRYLPVMSRITGVGGALFQAELTLANVSDSAASVTVTFLEHDQDNSASAHVATLTLAPRETRLIDDALSALFGLSQTFGAVKVASTQPIVLSERIYTASPTTPGTVGQQVDPVTPDTLYSHGSILGLRQDAAFRSNIGLFNPNDVPVTTSVTLRRPNGEILHSTYVTVPPAGMTQANLGGLFPGTSFPQGEPLTVMLDAGQLHISAYGIIADNVSQDLTASPGLP